MAELRTLTRGESLRLLRSVSLGRVVFSHLALPAIQPVNHVVDDSERIIIRAEAGSPLAAVVTGEGGAVVAYEADLMDPDDRQGWSVTVIGRAQRLTDPADIARYDGALPPWVNGSDDDFIAIQIDMVDGFRLAGDGTPGARAAASRHGRPPAAGS